MLYLLSACVVFTVLIAWGKGCSLNKLLHGSVSLEMDNSELRGMYEVTHGPHVSSLHCLFCWPLTVCIDLKYCTGGQETVHH